MNYLIILLALLLGASSVEPSVQHKKHEKPAPIPDWYVLKSALDYYGKYYRIPARVIVGVAERESPFDSKIPDSTYVSSKQLGKAGELGPMQIKLSTARHYWGKPVTRRQLLYDAKYNAHTAAKILDTEFLYWRDKYKDIDKVWLMVLTSYNLGRGAAKKLKGIPNDYARKIYYHDDHGISYHLNNMGINSHTPMSLP
jgi:soluble lytic murein transglycosylase-like protein